MVKRLLSRVKLLPQILMLGIIITVGFSSVLVYVYFRVQESMWEAKRVQSRNLVEAAYDIVDRYAVMAQEGTMGLAEAQAAAIDTIRPLRYEDDDYFWINDMEPRMVMQPTNTALEGEDLSDYEDPTGFRLFNEMVRVTRERGSGFVDYQWPKPGFDRPVPKVSYVQRHPGWDWVIGTGVYVDDVQADLAAMRWVMIIVGAAVAGLAVLFSFVLARSISQPMETLVQGAESLAEGDANVTGLDQAEREQIVARRDELGEIGRAFDGLVSYFRSKAEVAEAIAQGNLTVDVPLASDQDVLGAAMLEMKTSFLAMAESVNGLIDAAVAGKLDTRADVSEFEGEYRAIVDGVNRTLDAVIGPLNVAAEYVDRISKGDTPEQITDEYNGDFNEIKNNLNQLIEAENMVVEAAKKLAVGNTDVVLEARSGSDELVHSVIAVAENAQHDADALQTMARGDLDFEINVMSEDDVLAKSIVVLQQTLGTLVEDMKLLAEAAREGRLDTRADASRHQGEFAAMVSGVNDTLDAVIGPLNVAAEYVDRISKGDTPEQITDEYNGDFNEIKNNLNQLIEAENMVVEAAKKLAVGNTDVVLEARSGSDELVHSVIAVAENAQHDADAVQTMARGDLDFEINVMSEDDVMAKSIVVLQQTLGTLVEDMKLLAEAAREGRLDTRADASRHQGEFAAMVGGVNDTLDAVIGPLNVAAEYVDRISKGDIPEKITDEYNGDFNEIKNNLNVCIDTIEGLVDEMNVLTEAAVEGRLEVRGNVDGFGGDFGAIVQGANDTVDSLVGFLDAVPAPFMVIDRDFNVRYLNQTGADVVGQTQESTRGTKCYSLFNTGDCQSERCALGRAMREKTLAGSETQARVNGSVLDISYDGVPLLGLDGEVIGAMEVVTDQTAIKRAARQTQRIAEFQQQEVEKLQESLNALADGDLRRAYEVADADEETAETREAFAAIAAAFNRSVEGLRKMAGQMKEGAMNISSATSEILASSSQMASTTREQASAVTEVTSTVQEIQSSAEQVAQRAQGVAESAEQAARAAQDGSLAADEAIAAMGDIRQRVDAIAENILSLSEQTQQIGEIIDTVTDIADQSNILALNAAIEAAQAGEAGKGFRVVADEVRSLAEQSRQAAAQVKVILGDIQEASNRAVMATEQGTKQVAVGSDQVERTAQTIRELAATVEQSSQASEQIVVGVQQQTVGLDQIAVGMADINQASQQASAGAEQSENAARDLDTLGIDLERTVEQYKM